MTSPGLRVRVNLLARSYFGYPQTVQAVNDALNPFGIAELSSCGWPACRKSLKRRRQG